MRRLRISGLVRFARQVREELAGPVSAERLAQLRDEIGECIQAIEQIAKDKQAQAESLSLPSRKAYQFLKSLDLNTVATDESSATSCFPPDSVSFHGLQRHFDTLLDRLARSVDGPELKGVHETIVSDIERIEEEIRAQSIRPEQLKQSVRETRGWLAYFSQPENFEQYCAAVRRARSVFHTVSGWSAKAPFETLVHFRPMHGMYHVHGYSHWALVQLPTPAIWFDEMILKSVAQIAFKKKEGDRKVVNDAAGSEPYRKIASELERLGGVVEQTRGMRHDLAASFDRVNAEYFSGTMGRPHLVWSRSFTVRKYGHYEHAHDTVMVNAVLDRTTVPEFAVDFIIYHELLHKQLGITWKNNRVAVHTPKMREKERRFRYYEQARAVLRKLSEER